MDQKLFITIALFALQMATASEPQPIPGVLREDKHVYLMENHSTAWQVWHQRTVSNNVLIHLDAHDDCRYIAPGKLQTLAGYTAKRDFKEIFRLSDTERFLRMEVPESDALFDLGNFIYTCFMDGTITRMYWVIPDVELSAEKSTLLETHLKHVLQMTDPLITRHPGNAFSIIQGPVSIYVCTLSQLPEVPETALIDVDTDFFAFPAAMTESHLLGPLLWDPESVFKTLREKAPRSPCVTISASVWGGFLPLSYRHIADACFDYFSSGAYPAEGNLLLNAMEQAKQGNIINMDSLPTTGVYEAATMHLKALRFAINKQSKPAIDSIHNAAAVKPVYSKGFLDLAEAFASMNDFGNAHLAVDAFEAYWKKPTYSSLLSRSLLYLAEGKPEAVKPLSDKLVAWTRSPMILLIQGAVYEKQGQKDDALKIYNEILKANPFHVEARYNIGVIYLSQGKTAESREAFRIALLINPDFWKASESLGHILLQEGKTAEAEPLLRNTVRVNPRSLTSLNNLGLCLARQNRNEEAIVFYEKALKEAPTQSTVRLNLARALLAMQMLDKAEQQCRTALEHEPGIKGAAEILEEIGKSRQR